MEYINRFTESIADRAKREHFEREVEIMIESRKAVIDTTRPDEPDIETQLRIRLAEQRARLHELLELQPIEGDTFGDLIRNTQSEPEKKMTEDEAYRFRLGL